MRDAKSNKPTASVTVLFPMAGRAERFGGKFKPFLPIGDEIFIQAAVRPFRSWVSHISKFVFIYLEEQESQYNVDARLRELFADLTVETVMLEKPTTGPVETAVAGIRSLNLHGPAMICDCDHSVDPRPLFEQIRCESDIACLIPTWTVDSSEVDAWSIAAIDDRQIVRAISEKSFPSHVGRYAGVIGCYYFSRIERVTTINRRKTFVNFSDVIRTMIEAGEQVRAIDLAHAEFFGDPRRLDNATQMRRLGSR